MPCDQHFLLSLVAPRNLLVGSAKEDLWADPESEFLAAYIASEAYEVYGLTGLVTEDRVPKATQLSETEIFAITSEKVSIIFQDMIGMYT